MTKGFLLQLTLRRAEIARRWEQALRGVPARTALANPDTLRFMIEPVLTQLLTEAETAGETAWSPHSPPRERLLERVSSCALNPMIGFYFAGETALAAVARSLPVGPELSESELLTSECELLAALRRLGREDVTRFCEICLIEAPASAARAGEPATMPTVCPFKAARTPGN